MRVVSTLLSGAAMLGLVAAEGDYKFSKLTINQPDSLKAALNVGDDGVDNMPAMFGLPFSHQGKIQGELLTPDSRNDEGCTDFSEEDKATWRAQELDQAVIAVVHRGECTFVTKVRHVQEMGAQAAIIIDNIPERGIPYMADDGSGSSISIPSILVNKEQGDIIYDAVVQAMANPGTGFDNSNKVFATLAFNLPRPDNRVEWSIWASSAGGDEDGLEEFKRDWEPVGKALGAAALLTPHYWFMNGTYQGCATEELLCVNQCTNNGRYCNVDPDGDLSEGVAGCNIVRENLRQLCWWQTLNNSATHDISLYWEYANKFNDECYNVPHDDRTDHSPWEDCSFKLMKDLGGNDLQAKAAQCIDEAGGYAVDGGVNSMIEAEISKRNDMGIIFRPSVLVNEQKVIGSIACPKPYNPDTCGVFGAICEGFKNKSAIPACAPNPDPDCALGVVKDKCGVCGGAGGTCPDQCADGLVRDECGVCGGNSTAAECAITDSGSGAGEVVSKGVSAGVIVVIALIFLAFIGGFIYWYMKRREDAMREDIDSLLKQYLPMQDGAATA